MISTILEITISMSIVVAIMLILIPLTSKRYSAKWRYYIWLLVAIRLIIPINFTLPQAPITINEPERGTIVLRTDDADFPVAVVSESEYKEAGKLETSSANYAPIIDVMDLLMYVWLIGMIIFVVYNFVNYWVFIAKIRKDGKVIEIELVNKIIGELNIKKKPVIILCDKILSPMLVGFVRPIVILPSMDYTESELNVILKHELTHYKRHDLWYKFLMILANGVHWFNPFIYFMVNQANRDLEFSCDDAVVKNEGIEFRKEYSRTILKSMDKNNATDFLNK